MRRKKVFHLSLGRLKFENMVLGPTAQLGQLPRQSRSLNGTPSSCDPPAGNLWGYLNFARFPLLLSVPSYSLSLAGVRKGERARKMSSAQASRVNDAAQQQEQEYGEVDSFQARARGKLPLIPSPRFSALSTLVLGED